VQFPGSRDLGKGRGNGRRLFLNNAADKHTGFVDACVPGLRIPTLSYDLPSAAATKGLSSPTISISF
jgi:hypothetical protein